MPALLLPIENRRALYVLPWLAALLCLTLSLTLPPRLVHTLALTALLATIPLFGLPHGAADWGIMQSAAGPRWHHGWPRATILTAYLLASLVTLAFWRWQPALALAGFLTLTVWHFGTADASVLLPGHSPLRDPAWFLFALGRGLLVIFTPLAFRPAESALLLQPFTVLGGNVPATILHSLRFAPTLMWTGAILQIVALRLRPDRRTLPWNLLETGLLIALFRLSPPLLAFTGYFVAFHSWRHILRLESILHPARPLPLWQTVIDFHVRTLPVTALSLLGLVWIFAVWPRLLDLSNHAVTTYLIFLSILTVPHAVVIGWLDWQKKPANLPTTPPDDPDTPDEPDN